MTKFEFWKRVFFAPKRNWYKGEGIQTLEDIIKEDSIDRALKYSHTSIIRRKYSSAINRIAYYFGFRLVR